MSAFTPLDVRGPDQRRKQLIQKLYGQAQTARGVASAPPVQRTYPFLTTPGRSFRNAGTGGPPSLDITQLSSVLPGILAKLGIGASGPGIPIAAEHSAAPGLPVQHPIPAPAAPHANVAPPIPTPQPGPAPQAANVPPPQPEPTPGTFTPPDIGAVTNPNPAPGQDLTSILNSIAPQGGTSPLPQVATNPNPGPVGTSTLNGLPQQADNRYVQVGPNQWYDTLLDVVTGHRG